MEIKSIWKAQPKERLKTHQKFATRRRGGLLSHTFDPKRSCPNGQGDLLSVSCLPSTCCQSGLLHRDPGTPCVIPPSAVTHTAAPPATLVITQEPCYLRITPQLACVTAAIMVIIIAGGECLMEVAVFSFGFQK